MKRSLGNIPNDVLDMKNDCSFSLILSPYFSPFFIPITNGGNPPRVDEYFFSIIEKVTVVVRYQYERKTAGLLQYNLMLYESVSDDPAMFNIFFNVLWNFISFKHNSIEYIVTKSGTSFINLCFYLS